MLKSIKIQIWFFIVLLFYGLNVCAQDLEFLKDFDYKILKNESYGEFERNQFDILIPKSIKPTALIIFIHGGGFIQGDKHNGFLNRKEDIKYFLKNNIAFAAINYRFYKNNDSLGVKQCLRDIKQALQYIRFNSIKYNINKDLVGCYGISAGAGASLYLAFHDDMVIRGNHTFLGESTKLKCVGAIATQATYDIFKWKKFILGLKLIYPLKKKEFDNMAANFYGYKTFEAFKPNKKSITKSLDMLSMIDSDDPPVYLINMLKDRFPKDYNIIQHHRKHAIVLSKTLKKQKVEHSMFVYKKNEENESEIDFPIRKFLVEHLTK